MRFFEIRKIGLIKRYGLLTYLNRFKLLSAVCWHPTRAQNSIFFFNFFWSESISIIKYHYKANLGTPSRRKWSSRWDLQLSFLSNFTDIFSFLSFFIEFYSIFVISKKINPKNRPKPCIIKRYGLLTYLNRFKIQKKSSS